MGKAQRGGTPACSFLCAAWLGSLSSEVGLKCPMSCGWYAGRHCGLFFRALDVMMPLGVMLLSWIRNLDTYIMNRFLLTFLAVLPALLGWSQGMDGLKVKSYQLDNGLTILLNEDPTASRVYGAVMVNAGAMHESPDATGMAHYLEHLLFKGTDQMGTADYALEKPFLDSIRVLYTILGETEDKAKRLEIQKAINTQSVEASKYGLPNEFDKLIKGIGSTGVNAFTSYEMTFYHNSFPAHELNKWLDLYAERFRNPVFRSFQSELEVVYEEKNRAEDDFENRVEEYMSSKLFPNLPYGQWSVLGKTEHLKNPPLNEMYDFFYKHYVPNNMALILSGNFSAEQAVTLIEEKFGAYKADPSYKQPSMPTPIPFDGKQVERKRMTPVKAGFLGFHTVGHSHTDRAAMDVCEYLLENASETGLINKVQLDNEMLYCGTIPYAYQNTGALAFFYVPKVLIQSLANAEKKIWDGIDHLKNGGFTDEMLAGVKNEMRNDFGSSIENLEGRGVMIGRAFNRGMTWDQYSSYPQQVAQVTREDVMRVAKKYLSEDYLKVISRTGFPKKHKVDKPPFKPVATDQNATSTYASTFEKLASSPFEPRFLDEGNGAKALTIKGGHHIYWARNTSSHLFYMTLNFRTGKLYQPELEIAQELMQHAGAGDYSFSELKQAFANIGCSYYVSVADNIVSVGVKGDEAQFDKCLELVKLLLADPKASESSRKLMITQAKTNETIIKASPSQIGLHMFNYARYGKKSPALSSPTAKDYEEMDLEKILATFKEVTSQYLVDIQYVGSTSVEDLIPKLEQQLPISDYPISKGISQRELASPKENVVYFIHDKKARQSQVYFYQLGNKTDHRDYWRLKSFNEYFSGGFSGLVLQEIREYRSLAYSTGARYFEGVKPGKNGFFYSFIGCQADKTVDAVTVMKTLLQDMPEKPERMQNLQKALMLQVLTNFPSFKNIPSTLWGYDIEGRKEDPNRIAYEKYADLQMKDIAQFHREFIKDKPHIITIYGNKKKIDLEQLKQFGKVVELKLEDVVRY